MSRLLVIIVIRDHVETADFLPPLKRMEALDNKCDNESVLQKGVSVAAHPEGEGFCNPRGRMNIHTSRRK